MSGFIWARHSVVVLTVCLVASNAAAQATLPGPVGLQKDVVFTEYSALSRASELVRRLLSPLAIAQFEQALVKSGKALREQSINLSDERFVVYVPPRRPPDGYGVLVFIPPYPQATLPTGWASVLDREGVIFVSAARSGNDADALDRREPLALLAAHNIMHLYGVDPARVYVGGFSGGSRVAMRLALGFPDLFRGALLNAGSDPLGRGGSPLPPNDLFSRFQATTRLVYTTGATDSFHLAMDAQSTHSLRQYCVRDYRAEVIPWTDHTIATPDAFAQALQSLSEHVAVDTERSDACISARDRDLRLKLAEVERLLANDNRKAARRLIMRIDGEFGGLAAPQIVELARRCSCDILNP